MVQSGVLVPCGLICWASKGMASSMSEKDAPQPNEIVADPMLGQRIGEKYRIESLLARGGMGRVYKGIQEPLNRPVAIKILSPIESNNAANPQHEKRFLREASCTARLTHPNTVVIHDYGTIPETNHFYLVMEYLDGKTLRQLLAQNGPLSTGHAIHIAVQIAQSLQEAHRAGVVHRDLKPPNIMLVHRGNDPEFVKVLDFGLVKSIADDVDEDLTLHGTLVGSPAYMSPEQVLNMETDARSDIYSLGILLYEMLVGRPPFKRSGSSSSMNELVKAQVQTNPPPLRTFKPDLDIPSDLEHIIFRCLHKDPDKRYQSMDELVTALCMLPAYSAEITAVGRRLTGIMPVVTADYAESSAGAISAPAVIETPNTETGADFRPQQSVPRWVLPLLILAVLVGVGGVYALFGPDAPPTPLPKSSIVSVPATLSEDHPAEKKTLEPELMPVESLKIPDNSVEQGSTNPPEQATVIVAVSPTTTIPPPTQGSTVPSEVPQDITLSFVSTPSGVDVFDGDQLLGKTPFDTVVNRREFIHPRVFVFRRAGYIDKQVSQGVPDSAAVQIGVVLQEEPKPTPAVVSKPPKKKPTDAAASGKPPKPSLEIKGSR